MEPGAFGIPPDGFRLPAATRLGRVSLQVSDLDRSLEYYEKVLGFRVTMRDAGTATLSPHGDDVALVTLSARVPLGPTARRGTLGLYHFAILLPDRSALGRFVAHLTALRVNAGTADHAVSEAVYLSDPDGLGIEVYADRPRETWQRNGRQLHMTTEPLDLVDLVAAGGRQPWAGMPAGTLIGHVHLHVGDLDRAAAFYHSGLGFDKTVWEYPGALFLSAGGYHHHLGTNTWVSGPPAAEDQPRLLSWEIVVPRAEEADAAARNLSNAGYDVTPHDGGWSAVDPWGTRVVMTTSAIRSARVV